MFPEETGLDYTIHPVDISAGDQFEPEFLAFSPNNRMPAIIDTAPAGGGDAVTVFESGAILTYLAEKTGRFMPNDIRGRKTVMEWLFWQVGGLGPMAGQNHHFVQYAPEKIPTRWSAISKRRTGSMASWIDGSLIPFISRGTTTPSPTWRPMRGLCRGSGNNRTSTTFQTYGAG
jgi:GST-like protein